MEEEAAVVPPPPVTEEPAAPSTPVPATPVPAASSSAAAAEAGEVDDARASPGPGYVETYDGDPDPLGEKATPKRASTIRMIRKVSQEGGGGEPNSACCALRQRVPPDHRHPETTARLTLTPHPSPNNSTVPK